MQDHSQDEEDGQGSERWLVSYADFITLLFAFFVVLYATSQADMEKMKEFEESIKKTLQGSAKGFGGVTESTTVTPPPQVIENQLNQIPKTNMETSKVQKWLERSIEDNFSEKEVAQFFSELTDDMWGVRISVSAQALFLKDSIKLSSNGEKILSKLGSVLINMKKPVWIEGHSRTYPLSHSQKPWVVGALQATAVINYLIVDVGFAPSQLVAISHGDQRPLFKEKNLRSKNERVDFLILTEVAPI